MTTPTAARRVLELRRAGLGYAQIAAVPDLGLADAAEARAVYDQALEADDLRFSADLEISRLDRLHAAAWPEAIKGEVQAIDRVLKISERREHLINADRENGHELRDAFDASVAASSQILPVDQALIEAGRKIADRVDDAIATGQGQELTKALYLVPHLNNILREMLATPSARVNAGLGRGDNQTGGKLAQLRALNGGSRSSA